MQFFSSIFFFFFFWGKGSSVSGWVVGFVVLLVFGILLLSFWRTLFYILLCSIPYPWLVDITFCSWPQSLCGGCILVTITSCIQACATVQYLFRRGLLSQNLKAWSWDHYPYGKQLWTLERYWHMQKVHGKEELQSLVKLRIKLFIIVGCADRKKHSFVFCSWFQNLKPPMSSIFTEHHWVGDTSKKQKIRVHVFLCCSFKSTWKITLWFVYLSRFS